MPDISKEGLPLEEAPQEINNTPEISVPQTAEREMNAEKPSSREQKMQPSGEQPRKTKFLPPQKRQPPQMPARDEITTKIEKILEEGLNDSFQRLSPVAKQEFKIKGEQTANKIRDLLKSTHIQVKKIFRLILDWLRIVPGVNRFFLEQEAKIKTDRIIALKNKL